MQNLNLFVASLNIYELKYEGNNKIDHLISLCRRTSILDNLILIEKPNIDILNKLIKSDLLITKDYNGFVYNTELQHLEAYRNAIDDDGLIRVKYNVKRPLGFGRVYSREQLSAISLRRELRGSIFHGQYVDIDIANCHPNITLQIANFLGLNISNLHKYVNNRNEILQEVQDHYNVNRDTAKQLFIRLLFLGSFRSWASANNIEKPCSQYIQALTSELRVIASTFVRHNPELRKHVESYKNHKSQDGPVSQFKIIKSTMSFYLQEIENIILEHVYLFCKEHGYIQDNVACLCYDGIMLLKENYTDKLLLELHEVTYHKFGLNLTFEQKEMNHYLDILDNHITEIDKSPHAIDPNDLKTLEYKLLKLINNKHLKNYKFLATIGRLVKSLHCFKSPYSIWIELCKRGNSINYNSWDSFKPTSFNTKSLHFLAKSEDKCQYYEVIREYRIECNQEYLIPNARNIERRYLLDKDKLLDDNDNEVCSSLNDFFNDRNIKSLSIKSPYDTGKTQLLKQVMTKFNPKRVLWLSYRKTLTYDIYTNFNRFGFKSYLDHHYNADRIIIQLESLLHIEGDCFFLEDDVIEDTQRYDLIIIDEIESILNQFSSDATFKGRNHMTFEYMMDIIKVSNKVIALDGDMACRSYSFLDKLGLSININNVMNFNTKTIRIINDEIDFIQMIIHSFRYGQKYLFLL
jgi:hypothetical protein